MMGLWLWFGGIVFGFLLCEAIHRLDDWRPR